MKDLLLLYYECLTVILPGTLLFRTFRRHEPFRTSSVWPVFLIAGLLFLCGALFVQVLISIVLGLLGAGCLWSIRELKEQAHRVERGWFPKNPKRK